MTMRLEIIARHLFKSINHVIYIFSNLCNDFNTARVFLYEGLRILTICSKTVVGQCVLTIPSTIAGSWFTSGQYWKSR